MGNYYAYMRISTEEDRGLQKYNRQEGSLKRYAKENGIEFLLTFKEDKSGKNFSDRKEWNKLDKIVREGDTIVFKDLYRFTREAENGYQKYMELLDRGVELIFIDNQIVSTPYIKQLLNIAQQQNLVAKISLENTVKLLLYVELDRAEQERLTTSQRIKDGIANSNKKSGRPIGKLDKVSDALRADISAYLSNRDIKQVDLMKKHDISRNTLIKYINLAKEGKI